jgi:hypothetical protein
MTTDPHRDALQRIADHDGAPYWVRRIAREALANTPDTIRIPRWAAEVLIADWITAKAMGDCSLREQDAIAAFSAALAANPTPETPA